MQVTNSKKKNTTFYLYEKAKSKNKIRVLYKQVGKTPRVRIIPNVQILKRAIINRKLDIIPYQNVFLICNNQDYMKTSKINVVFDFFHISGDLLVVQIDKEKREFENLPQEDISWFTSDLIYSSFNIKLPKPNVKQKANSSVFKIGDYLPKNQKEIAEDTTCNFETSLIKTLTNIELILASSLLNSPKKGGEQ